MIATNDGYAIMQETGKNRIIITLPQTFSSLNWTTSYISERRRALTEAEEAVILSVVKKMYDGGVVK